MFLKHPIKAFVFFFCATHCESQIRLGSQTMVKENNVLKYEPLVGSYFKKSVYQLSFGCTWEVWRALTSLHLFFSHALQTSHMHP